VERGEEEGVGDEREGGESLANNLRERKDKGNEIFCVQNHINILLCAINKIPYTSSVFNTTLILNPY
jgi:hypothetical protein